MIYFASEFVHEYYLYLGSPWWSAIFT